MSLKDAYAALLEHNGVYPSGLVFRSSSNDRMGGFKREYSRWVAEDAESTRQFAAMVENKRHLRPRADMEIPPP